MIIIHAMRVFLIALFFLGGLPFKSRAQFSLPAPNGDIPLLICPAEGGHPGSGFFLSNGTNQFLVTAKHVLYTNSILISSNFVCVFNRRSPTNYLTFRFNLDLNYCNTHGHIKSHPTRDVAVVRVGIMTNTAGAEATTFISENVPGFTKGMADKFVYSTIEKNVKLLKETTLGNEVYLFGYPIDITAHSGVSVERPLLRRGIVADVDEGNKRIILDCPSYGGNSGGAVMEIDKGVYPNRMKIIGVMTTQFRAFTSTAPAQGFQSLYNSGYSLIEPMDFVLELLW